jgi:hypothetical protein
LGGDAILLEVGSKPFLFPRRIEERVALVLRGKHDVGVLPDAPPVRRILDIGAGVGDFACWAWKRWGPAWVDCYESDPVLLPFLGHNLPPGAAIRPEAIKDAAAAAKLPPCDVLRVEGVGNEAEILRGYRHRPGIVCVEWNRDEDRRDFESTLSSWGLRCFRIAFKHTDFGHETWVRSKAIWNEEKKGFVLP